MRSACRERSQRSRTQQLQCATVSQHSMYSYIVESGRERCDQHPQAFLKLGGGTHKAHRVSQGRRMTVPVLRCHQKPVLARLWGGMSSCGLSIETITTLDRFVLRSAPHVLRLGRYISAITTITSQQNGGAVKSFFRASSTQQAWSALSSSMLVVTGISITCKRS